MEQQIIYPSTSDASFKNRSTGYEYTMGPKPSLPDEYMRSPLTSKLYSESLNTKKHEVSLSAMTFLFQEMISQIHKNCQSLNDFETKLDKYGESIGMRLLELLNFRSSISPGTSSRTSTFLSSSPVVNTTSTNTNTNANTSSSMNSQPGSGPNRSRANTGTSSKDTASSVSTKSNRTSTDRHSHHTQSQQAQHTQVESLTSQISKMRRRDLKIIDILQFVHGTLWSYLFNHVSDDLVKSSERNNEYMIIDNQPPLTQFISSSNNRISCDYFICGVIRGFLTNAGFRCKVSPHLMPKDNWENRTVYLIQFDNQVLERETIRFGQS